MSGRIAGFTAVAALITLYYTAFATRLSFDLWQSTNGGFLFNGMLDSLLDGRMDLNPAIVGMEGYQRDGRTYTYFGILPALLRVPVLSHLWLDWTTASSIAAAAIATMASLLTMERLFHDLPTARLRIALTTLGATAALSGPSIEMLGKPAVYTETILWAYAIICVFMHVSTPFLLGATPRARRYAVLAACAAAALLTRASAGIALYAALAAITVFSLRAMGADGLSLAARARRLGPGLLIAASAIVLTGGINHLRWGNPLKFNDFTHYTIIQDSAARQARVERYGAFNSQRLPYALAYYGAPDWFFSRPADSVDAGAIKALFDPPEGPPSSLPATLPLWFATAAAGAAAGLRGRRTWRPARVAALTAALLLAPLLVLSYLYLSFRYRAEFVPPLLLLAIIGTRVLLQPAGRPVASGTRAFVLVALLCVLAVGQILLSHRAAVAHGCSPYGGYSAEHDRATCTFFR